MRAWVVHQPGPVDGRPLVLADKPDPVPGPHEVRVRVVVCGVCRTDLHLAEGDLPPHGPTWFLVTRSSVVVDALGPGPADSRSVTESASPGSATPADRAVSAIVATRTCASSLRFTGWDADGGYAEHAVVDERFAYRLPDVFGDEEAAPLLCAGIIGFRALRRAALPPGGRLGIYGFGGSAHLAAQVALAEGATVHVHDPVPRGPTTWRSNLALPRLATPSIAAGTVRLGHRVRPRWRDRPVALEALDRGGTAGRRRNPSERHPTSAVSDHLFQERQLRSVTANTRQDGEEFLALAARIAIRVETVSYPLEQADRALRDLAHDQITGAAVLRVAP